MSFSNIKNNAWTSIAGRAEIVRDRAKAEQLYTPTLEAWFPDGLDTPGLTLIKIHADTAEFWEGPTSTVAFVLKTVRAAVTNNPDHDPVSTTTVEL